jgi:hypothetical protein
MIQFMVQTGQVSKWIIFLIIFSQPVLFPILSNLLEFRPSYLVILCQLSGHRTASAAVKPLFSVHWTAYKCTVYQCTVHSDWYTVTVSVHYTLGIQFHH